jgi:hypothetical protein
LVPVANPRPVLVNERVELLLEKRPLSLLEDLHFICAKGKRNRITITPKVTEEGIFVPKIPGGGGGISMIEESGCGYESINKICFKIWKLLRILNKEQGISNKEGKSLEYKFHTFFIRYSLFLVRYSSGWNIFAF